MKPLTMLGLLLVCALPLLAQPAQPALAFIEDEALKLLANGTTTILSDVPTYDYSAAWSPDGRLLAYVTADPADAFSQEKTLVVTDGRTITEIGRFVLNTGIDLSWTRDGRILYMVDTGEYLPSETLVAVLRTQFYAVAPEAGAVPELIADNVPFGVGCGGGTSSPMDHQMWRETDFGGSQGIAVLTDYGIVHTGVCVGNQTSLTRPFTGETLALGDGNISRAIVSPDRRTVAGIASTPDSRDGVLTLVDLETLETRTLATTDAPDQLAYDAAGSLYYSAWVLSGDLLAGLTPQQRDLVAAALGYATDGGSALEALPRYETRLYRVAADGTETRLYTGDAYAIGRMAVSGQTLFFSEVSNGDAWVQAVLDGAVTFDNSLEVGPDFVPVMVYALSLSDNSVTPLGRYQQFAVQPVR